MKLFARYLGALVRVAFDRRRGIIPLVIAQIIMLLPLVFGFPSGYEAITLVARQNLDLKTSLLSSAQPAGIPQDVIDADRQERDILSEALSAADGSAAQLEGLADYYSLGASSEAASRDSELWLLDQARATLLRSIAELKRPEVYQTTRQMPFTYYLAYSFWVIPVALVGIVVATGVSSVLSVLCDGRLLCRAPVSEPVRWLGAYLVMLLASVVYLLAAVAPTALITVARSGAGSLDYPVVSVLDGEVVVSTVGRVLAGDVALTAMALAWGQALMTLVVASSSSPAAGRGVIFAAFLLPLLPLYHEPGMPWRGLLTFLPMTYLLVSGVVGAPLYVNGSEMRYASGATLGLGAAVCGASVLLLLMLLTFLGLGRDAARRRRLAPSAATRPAVLGLDDVSVGHGRRHVVHVSSFSLASNAVTGLVAPNGSGKTSLMAAMAEPWLPGVSGRVSRVGATGSCAAWRRAVVFVPGPQMLYPWLTGRQQARVACGLWGSGARLDKLAKLLGAEALLDVPVRRCSQGMAQLVCLTVALCTGAACLLLDEPTSALDFKNVGVVSGALRSYAGDGKAVMLSTHDVANVDSSCDRVAWIVDGELACDEAPALGRRSCAEEYERRYAKPPKV